MKRGLKITLLAIPALLVLALLAVTTVLGTAPGSRWVLGLVPGLSVENFQGRLGGQWSADHLVWQQDTSRVELNKAIFAWSPLCLTRMTLCIEQLHAEQVVLQFAPSTEPSSGPISLPELKLPLAIELGEELGVPMWVCHAVRLVLKNIVFSGAGNDDISTIVRHIEKPAGLNALKFERARARLRLDGRAPDRTDLVGAG